MTPGVHVAQHGMPQDLSKQQGPKIEDCGTITDDSLVVGTYLKDPLTDLPDIQAKPFGMLSSPAFLPALSLPPLSLPPPVSTPSQIYITPFFRPRSESPHVYHNRSNFLTPPPTFLPTRINQWRLSKPNKMTRIYHFGDSNVRDIPVEDIIRELKSRSPYGYGFQSRYEINKHTTYTF